MNTGVYQIKNNVNGKIYIGSTSGKGFDHRWRFHKDTLNKNKHHNNRLQNSWNKHGEKNFLFSIIEECIPEECLIKEQFYIDHVNPYYNIYRVAGSPRGRILSEESKVKISNALKGRNLSENTKYKISQSMKGRQKSKEHINKVCLSLWGDNGKLRNTTGGRFSGYYIFLNIKTGEKIICGKFQLADKYGLDRSGVCKLCNGKRKSIKKEWVCLGKENKYGT